MFWTSLIGVMVFCASTGVALGAALGLTPGWCSCMSIPTA